MTDGNESNTNKLVKFNSFGYAYEPMFPIVIMQQKKKKKYWHTVTNLLKEKQ